MKILIGVDGSPYSRAAARYVAAQAKRLKQKPEVHLIHVHAPLPYRASGVVGRKAVDSYYRDESEQALAGAARELRKARVAHKAHWTTGDPARRIASYAKKDRFVALSKIPVLVVPKG